jgi:hypothetical protein
MLILYICLFGFIGYHVGKKRTSGGFTGLFLGAVLGIIGLLIILSFPKY